MRRRAGASILGCRWPLAIISPRVPRAQARRVGRPVGGRRELEQDRFPLGGSARLGGESTRRRNVRASPYGNRRPSPAAAGSNETRLGRSCAGARGCAAMRCRRAPLQRHMSRTNGGGTRPPPFVRADQATPAGSVFPNLGVLGQRPHGLGREHDLERVRLRGGREDVVRGLRVGEREPVRRERRRVEPAALR